LLGEAMAMQEGLPFDQVLADRITGPLGLTEIFGEASG
jgi:CubicO group peptidase (beta-lactamase class C family)